MIDVSEIMVLLKQDAVLRLTFSYHFDTRLRTSDVFHICTILILCHDSSGHAV